MSRRVIQLGLLATGIAACHDPGLRAPVVASVQVEGVRASVAVGDTMQLRAVGLDAEGRPIAQLEDVRWSTPDTQLVRVTPTGVVEGLAPGDVILVPSSARYPSLVRGGYQTRVVIPPMTIHVASPTPDTLVLSRNLLIAATCTVENNVGRRCAALQVGLPEAVVARGTEAVRVDTAFSAQRNIAVVRFTAVDSVRLSTGAVYVHTREEQRTAYFPDARLRVVGRVGLAAREFDGRDALFDAYLPETYSTALWFGPPAGQPRLVTPDRYITAHLTGPSVVWYTRQPTGSFSDFDLVEWRDGVTIPIGRHLQHIEPIVEGSYGLWSEQDAADTVLYLRNVATGVTTRVASGVRGWRSGGSPFYVTPGGVVYFIRGSSASGAAGLYRWSGGQETLVRPGDYSYVRADEVSLVLSVVNGPTLLITSLGESELAPRGFPPVNSGGTVVLGEVSGTFSERPHVPLYAVYVRRWDGSAVQKVFDQTKALVYVRQNGDVVVGAPDEVPRFNGICSLAGPTRATLPLPSCRVIERGGKLYVMQGPYILAID